jgi:hypothetical protein
MKGKKNVDLRLKNLWSDDILFSILLQQKLQKKMDFQLQLIDVLLE